MNSCFSLLSRQVAHRLKQAVQELGVSCVQLVQDGGKVHSDPSDSYARKVLSDNARRVPEKVNYGFHMHFLNLYCVVGTCELQKCF